jgi:hypothetical protein
VAGIVSGSCSSPCPRASPKDEVPAIGQTRAADWAVMAARRFLRALSRPNKDPPLPRHSGASLDVCGCWLSHEPEGRCESLSFDSISDDNFAQINDDFP